MCSADERAESQRLPSCPAHLVVNVCGACVQLRPVVDQLDVAGLGKESRRQVQQAGSRSSSTFVRMPHPQPAVPGAICRSRCAHRPTPFAPRPVKRHCKESLEHRPPAALYLQIVF